MLFRFLLPIAILSLSSALCTAQTLPIEPEPPHDHAICGTPLILSIQQQGGTASGNQLLALSRFCSGREVKQFNIVSPAGYFRVHYNTSGSDSVSIIDQDANGIPDYIDSVAYYADMAWKVEVEDYGYTEPPPDNLNPNSGGIDGRFDIYICELDPGYYGAAFPEASNPVGNGLVSGYIVMDRDYKESLYSSKGIEGVRVTTAHEFHHLIQFSAYRYDLSQASFYEATSTWFERQVHPTLDDYRQYVVAFLTKPWINPFSTHQVNTQVPFQVIGYGHEMFMDYVATKFNRDIVRRFWEIFRDNDKCFEAIDLGLREHGTNLENSYCEFARWAYYTGYRAKGQTLLKEAPSYPAMRAEITMPLGPTTVLPGTLQPLAFTLMQVTVPTSNPNVRDTVNFLVTNARSDIGAGGPQLPSTTFTIDVSPEQESGYTPLKVNETRTIYYRLNTSSVNFCLDAITDEINTTIAVNTSPQPFINDGGNQLLLGVGMIAEQVTSAELHIYSAAMIPIATVRQDGLQGQNNQLGVLWNGRTGTGTLNSQPNGDLAPSGVYIYELSINGSKPALGKIAVVRK